TEKWIVNQIISGSEAFYEKARQLRLITCAVRNLVKTAGGALLRSPKLVDEHRHGVLADADRRQLRTGSELAERCQFIHQRIARSMALRSILDKQQRLLILDYVSAGTHQRIILRDCYTSMSRFREETMTDRCFQSNIHERMGFDEIQAQRLNRRNISTG